MLGRATAILLALSSAGSAAHAGRLGVMVDAGVPDGINGSLVYRPVRWFHLHGGAGSNLISFGVRAGASLYLLPTAVSPTLNLEVGHYMTADASPMATRLGLVSEDGEPLLRELGYDYGNAHLGMDFGRDRFSFYVHAGASVIRGKLGLSEALSEQPIDGMPQQPEVTAVVPSARIGLLFLF